MHLILIVAIIVIVFGPSKLPELGSSLGKGIREFKRSSDDIKEIKETVNSAISLEPTRKPVASTAAPLPNQPEPRHEPVTLSRQEID
jgi:sec-independent protein translocase protein TatA